MTPVGNSFFAGGGLIEIGLEEGGCKIQQSFEVDATCCATIRQNDFKGDREVVEGDLTKTMAKRVKPADFNVFTYPCTKYSTIADIHGARTGDEMYLHALRFQVLKPTELYAIENVPGMRKFPVVMEAMTALPGYYVTAFCPVSAHLWLPQKRDRLIILASRRPFAWRPPENTRPVTLAEIIEETPEVEIPEYVYRRLRGKYRDLPIISDPAAGDIAPTCVAHYSKDVSTRLVRDARFPEGVRPYSVREYARLQGVPDHYQFSGTPQQQYRQIGNGVAVPVGRWMGQEFHRYFNHQAAA